MSFEIVDTTNELLSTERETLAAALSVTRSSEWKDKPWKIYDPEGYVVADWARKS